MIKRYKNFAVTCLAIYSVFSANCQTWESMGTGSIGSTRAFVFDGNNIYGAGAFMQGANVIPFGKFESGVWNPVGNFMGFATIYTAVKSGDNIYVGGNFNAATGNADFKNIIRYHIPTDTWHALGNGLNAYVNSIAVDGNTVYAGGRFTDAGGDANADYIAKWDGTSWSALTSTTINTNSFTSVNTLGFNNGQLYIGTNMDDLFSLGIDYLCKYDGTNITDVGGWAKVGGVFDIHFDAQNNLYIGGEFPGKIAKWDGTAWSTPGTDTLPLKQSVWAITTVGNDLYIGGEIKEASENPDVNYIAKLNGSTWEKVGTGLPDKVWELAYHDGYLYVGGNFKDVDGNPDADGVVRIETAGGPGPSGIEKISNEGFLVYPNPTFGLLQVNVNQVDKGNIKVLNIIGNTVLETTVNSNQIQLDLTALPKGMYFINYQNTIEKIVLQ